MSRIQRMAVLFQRFGPYHVARLEGAGRFAAERGAEIVGVEIARTDKTYDWQPVADGKQHFRRVTLFDRAYEDVAPRDVRTAVRECLGREHPDAVALPGWGFPESISGLGWCGKSGAGAVLMSESSRGDARRYPWREWWKRRIVRRFGAALVGGQPQAGYVRELGIAAEAVFPGYDVVDNRFFADGAAKARSQADVLRAKLALPANFFLGCSRFVPKKNIEGLLDAFAEYRKAAGGGAWSLVICGDGPLKQQLLAQAQGLGIRDDVRFAGFAQYADLPAYYGLARAFVLASTTEQWGLVVNEAMASGLPVLVSSRCGCAPDLVQDNVNGFAFDPANTHGLARLLARVSAEDADLQALGKASARLIQKWSPEFFGESLWRAATASLART